MEREEALTQHIAPRVAAEPTLALDPEVQAVLLPSLCSCLRTELGRMVDSAHEWGDAETVDRACDGLGIPTVGTPIRRARACLVALGL